MLTNLDTTELKIDGGASEEDAEEQIDEYQISSSPNDFNLTTIANFMDKGAIEIPGFQRHYVWDLKRASKLIESLIIGLPIPQIFLYEREKNSFLVIDGQQRLLSIYFFVKRRFPRNEFRTEIRSVFNSSGAIPDDLLNDDRYFQNFNLRLPKLPSGAKNRFHGLNYSTLGDYQTSFDLRTIRNVIVRQLQPSDDDSSVYEMFSRLNSGGVNLRPQEIRASMYHSKFFDLLFEQNARPEWRKLLGTDTPDLHMRDIELLLRAYALLDDSQNYKPSMTAFLNRYCKKSRTMGAEKLEEAQAAFDTFFRIAGTLDSDLFWTRSGFSAMLFEAVFRTLVTKAPSTGGEASAASIKQLKDDAKFREASEARTNDSSNVRVRLGQSDAIVAFEV
jgi:hypothetical protein